MPLPFRKTSSNSRDVREKKALETLETKTTQGFSRERKSNEYADYRVTPEPTAEPYIQHTLQRNNGIEYVPFVTLESTVGHSASKSEPKIGSSEVDSSKILAQCCTAVKDHIKSQFRLTKATDQGGYILHHFISIESELLKFQKHSAWKSSVIEDSENTNKERIAQKSKRAIAFHKSNLLAELLEIQKLIRNLKKTFDGAGIDIQSVRLWLPFLAFRVLSARNSYKELRISGQIKNTAKEKLTKKECWTILGWILSVLEFLETGHTVSLPMPRDAIFEWIHRYFEKLTEASFHFI